MSNLKNTIVVKIKQKTIRLVEATTKLEHLIETDGGMHLVK